MVFMRTLAHEGYGTDATPWGEGLSADVKRVRWVEASFDAGCVPTVRPMAYWHLSYCYAARNGLVTRDAVIALVNVYNS